MRFQVLGWKVGKFQCILKADDAEKRFIFQSAFPTNIPSNKRELVCELLMRINIHLYNGNFVTDLEYGEISFRTILVYEDMILTKEAIGHVIVSNVVTMERYYEFFNTIIYSEISKSDALNKTKEFMKVIS